MRGVPSLDRVGAARANPAPRTADERNESARERIRSVDEKPQQENILFFIFFFVAGSHCTSRCASADPAGGWATEPPRSARAGMSGRRRTVQIHLSCKILEKKTSKNHEKIHLEKNILRWICTVFLLTMSKLLRAPRPRRGAG